MQFQPHLRTYVRYTSLNVLGMLGLSCYILADTFFVSKGLGSSGLAALNLAIPVYNFIHGTGLMLGIGGATRFALAKGKNDDEGSTVFTHTLLFGVCFAILFLLLGLFGAAPLTSLLGADQTVFEMTKTYLQVLLLFSPAFLLNDIMLCFVRNDGAPHLAMAAMVGGSLSNVVLDYVFIFPLQMGIFGAVFATGLAPVISLMILSPFFLKKKNSFCPVRCRLNMPLSQRLLACGLPSLVTEVSSGVVIMVFNMILLSLAGNTAVAAYGVVANLSLVVIAIYTGIAQGIQPLVSRGCGLGDTDAVKTTLRYAVWTVAVFSVALYAAVFFFADGIAAVFNSGNDLQLQKIAVDGLRIYFIGCLSAGMNILLSSYFASSDSAKPANLISLLRGLILIVPLSFLLSWAGGITGLWAVFPTTETLVLCLAVWVYIHKQSKKKKA